MSNTIRKTKTIRFASRRVVGQNRTAYGDELQDGASFQLAPSEIARIQHRDFGRVVTIRKR